MADSFAYRSRPRVEEWLKVPSPVAYVWYFLGVTFCSQASTPGFWYFSSRRMKHY
jgi:hypothetical protein